MPRLVASLSALLIACGCFIVGGAPLLRDDGAAVLPSSVQVHALPREGSPLAPPDGAVAAYLAPEGGCLVTLTLVGGGGGGGTLTSECAPPSSRCAARVSSLRRPSFSPAPIPLGGAPATATTVTFWAGGAAAGIGGDEAAFAVAAGAGGAAGGDAGLPGGDTRLWLGACSATRYCYRGSAPIGYPSLPDPCVCRRLPRGDCGRRRRRARRAASARPRARHRGRARGRARSGETRHAWRARNRNLRLM
jgi:hypothetical protein